MKILHLTEYFYPFALGGTEWSVFHLLQDLKKRGHEVFLLTPNYGAVSSESYKGISVFRYPFIKKIAKTQPKIITPFWHSNPLTWFTTFIYLVYFINKHKIEIIHVQSKSLILAGVMVQWLLKIPIVITLRDYYPLCSYGLCLTRERNYKRCNIKYLLGKELPKYLFTYTKNFPNKIFHYTAALYSRVISNFLLFSIGRAKVVVCISQKMQKIYQINGIHNTQVIYNSTHFFGKLSQKPLPVILFVGRLTPGKGIDIFIQAVRELLNRYPELSVECIGEGLMRTALESSLSIFQKKHIHFLGQLTYAETLGHMKKVLVVVVPSVWEEPFGRVALEALSYGVPVVATNRGGLPEIVTTGKTGYLVDPDKKSLEKAIEKAILNNRKLREGIKLKYDDLMQTFSILPINSYIKLYQDCKAI